MEDKERKNHRRRREKSRGKGKSGKRVKKLAKDSNVMVSGAMLMEVENVLQTQVIICYSSYNYVNL